MNVFQLDFLKQELQRLSNEEEERKRDYYGGRADLQEIWDKLVSLRTHINKFESEIENAKIEDIMRGVGNIEAMNYMPSSNRNLNTSMSIESAGRLADINKLKEKLRMKDVVRGRIAILEDKILDGRRQLTKCSDAMKSGAAYYTLNTEMFKVSAVSLSNTTNPSGSVHRNMALRQALLAISENVTEWEDDLLRSITELKQLEADVSHKISSTVGQDTDMSVFSSPASSPTKPVSMNTSNKNINVDESIVDLITHGPPLSGDLVHALRQGVEHLFDANNNRNMSINSECEFSLHEVTSGQAAIVRINGEAPKLYMMRLQRRLGSLLTLELQIQLEFQAKVTQVKHSRDVLREVEIKRLRVELQLSNLTQAIQATQTTPAAVQAAAAHESALRQFSSQLSTPAAKLKLSRVNDMDSARPQTVQDAAVVSSEAGQGVQGSVVRGVANGRSTSPPKKSTTVASTAATPTRIPTRTPARSPSPSKTKPITTDTTTVPVSNKSSKITTADVSNNKLTSTPSRSLPSSPVLTRKSITSSPRTAQKSISPGGGRGSNRVVWGANVSASKNSGESSVDSGGVSEGYTYGIMPDATTVANTITNASTTVTVNGTSASKSVRISSPKRQSPARAKHVPNTVSTVRSNASNNTTPTSTAPTYTESAAFAAAILGDILKQQSLRLASPHTPAAATLTGTPHSTLSALTPHSADDAFVSPESRGSAKRAIGKSPSTKDIHRLIMDYIKSHNLDPHVYYAGIIKAIKIQVLSSLLSRDLSQDEVAHTAFMINASPMRNSTGSNRLHRYFNNSDGVLSPIPLPAEYTAQDNDVSDGEGEHNSTFQHSLNVSYPAGHKNPKQKSVVKSSTGIHNKRWSSSHAQKAITTFSSNETILREEKMQLMAAQALQNAVSALSETYNEEDLEDKNECKYAGRYSKGHNSVRRSCSCAGCRAALGEGVDEYNYHTHYNRHGHRTAEALSEAPSSHVFTENIGNILTDSPPNRNRSEERSARDSLTSLSSAERTSPGARTEVRAGISSAERSRSPPKSARGGDVDFSERKLQTRSPGRRWSDPMHISREELNQHREEINRTETSAEISEMSAMQNNFAALLDSADTPLSPWSGGAPRTRHSLGSTRRSDMSPGKALRKNTYQSPSPIRDNPRFNTSSKASPAPVVRLSANEGDLRVDRGTPSARRASFGTSGRAAAVDQTTANKSTTGGIALSFPSTFFKKPESKTTSPVRERLRAQERPQGVHKPPTVANPKFHFCLICSTMVAPDGTSSAGSGDKNDCTHSMLSSVVPETTHVQEQEHEQSYFDDQEIDSSTVRAGGLARLPSPKAALSPRSSLTKSLETNTVTVPSSSLFESDPHSITQQSRTDNVRLSNGSHVSASSDFEQLLLIVAAQQKQIDELRAGRHAQPVPPSPEVVNAHAIPAAHHTKPVHAVPPPAARSFSEGNQSVDRLGPTDNHHQHLSVSKPRLGGSGALLQDSAQEPSTSSDLSVPSLHSRRAVRPTSLNSSGVGVIGGSGSERRRVGDQSVESDRPPAHPTISRVQPSPVPPSVQPAVQPVHVPQISVVPPAHPIDVSRQSSQQASTPASLQATNHVASQHHSAPALSKPSHVPNLSELADGSPHQIQGEVTLPLPPLSVPIGSFSEDYEDNAPENSDQFRHEVVEQSGRLSPQFALHAVPHVNAAQSFPVHYSAHAQPVPHPHAAPNPLHYHLPLGPDPTGQLILRCLHERIEKLARKYETARSQEILHPHFGVAMNIDGTSKAYVDVNIISAKNLPEMKILSRRCDAYIETQLLTQLPTPHHPTHLLDVHTLHTMSVDTSTFMSGYVYKRLDLLYHAHNYAHFGWPAGGVDANLLDKAVDDVVRGVQYHSYSRTSVKPETLFPEWREFFKITGVSQLSAQYLHFTIRDSAYLGHEISQQDPVIGFAVLPLSAQVLSDQHPHAVWVPLQQPQHHKNSAAHKLREDCALKVEVKVHYSEQQYWLDLRAETEGILRKVGSALGHHHTPTHSGAGLESSELTTAEGKKLEKWLEAMTTRTAQSLPHSTSAPVQLGQQIQHPPLSAAPITYQPVSGSQYPVHVHARQQSDPYAQSIEPSEAISNGITDRTSHTELPHLPLSLHSPTLAFSPHGFAPSINSSMTHSPNDPAYFSLQRPYSVAGRLGFNTPNGLVARHAASPITPTISAAVAPNMKSTESNLSNGAKTNSASFTRPIAEARATLKYMGLREESNRDIFYKSLRSSVDPSNKPSNAVKARTPRSQQSIGDTTPTNFPRGSSRAFTAESFFASQSAKAPPALPYESKATYPTAQNNFRNPEKRVEPELSRERNQRTERSARALPPPLPAQLTGEALLSPPTVPNKIDLSIFKRARSDIVYQGEVRNDTGNKLMRTAASKNEKVGFMSGKLRQLKFT